MQVTLEMRLGLIPCIRGSLTNLLFLFCFFEVNSQTTGHGLSEVHECRPRGVYLLKQT